MAEPERVINIVLVGRTGNGKSSTGNTLVGEKLFIAKKQAVGVTMECQMVRTAIEDGPIINVIDTPGLFDLSVSAEDLSKEIIKCLAMAEEGIHAVLFVLSLKTRISQEEESTLNSLQCIFESKMLDYFIVVFTSADELDEEGQTLEDYLTDDYPEFLKKVLRLCGGRKVLFDNKTTDKNKKAAQLKQLLAHIEDIGKQNGGIPYTDYMHRRIKEENDKLREIEKEIESKNLAEAEAAAMMERSRTENEETMKIMAQLVEKTLKESAEAHEKQMRELKEEMQDGKRREHENQMLAQVENTLKQNTEAHEREIRELKEEIKQGQRQDQQQQIFAQMMENTLKQNAEAHAITMKHSVEAHERQMRELRQAAQERPPHVIQQRPPECNIM